MSLQRAIVVVVDSAGVGAAGDAAEYGDEGANTVAHAAEHGGGLRTPTLGAWGLGHLADIRGVPPAEAPRAAWGRMREASHGKDTTTGHWELMGLVSRKGFETFPDGFPAELIDAFTKAAGRGVQGNRTASGTAIIEELGTEHLRTGDLIVYTSADSVFQIAAHEEVVPLEELYATCAEARVLCDGYRVGRVIARPFVGDPGSFTRTYHRRDFAMPPFGPTLLDRLAAAGIPVVGVGKIRDIFSGRGVSESVHTKGDADGIERTLEVMERVDRGLLFVNLIDLDMLYGHRRNPDGYARNLERIDAGLSAMEARMRPDDVIVVVADHGNDPSHHGTDHTREDVPLLLLGRRAVPLGARETFADLAQTLAEAFGVDPTREGTSFWGVLNGA